MSFILFAPFGCFAGHLIELILLSARRQRGRRGSNEEALPIQDF